MKCEICNQKKAKRFCPANNNSICSLCCGENRNVNINCVDSCEFLQKGTKFQEAKSITKEINQLIAENETTEENDPFGNDEDFVHYAYLFESFLCDSFYDDKNFNDDMLFEILSYIYLDKPYSDDDEIKQYYQEILKEYNKLGDGEYAKAEKKKKVILRILQSIQCSSGSILGNKNYFEMIYSQFYTDGKWTYLFGRSDD